MDADPGATVPRLHEHQWQGNGADSAASMCSSVMPVPCQVSTNLKKSFRKGKQEVTIIQQSSPEQPCKGSVPPRPGSSTEKPQKARRRGKPVRTRRPRRRKREVTDRRATSAATGEADCTRPPPESLKAKAEPCIRTGAPLRSCPLRPRLPTFPRSIRRAVKQKRTLNKEWTKARKVQASNLKEIAKRRKDAALKVLELKLQHEKKQTLRKLNMLTRQSKGGALTPMLSSKFTSEVMDMPPVDDAVNPAVGEPAPGSSTVMTGTQLPTIVKGWQIEVEQPVRDLPVTPLLEKPPADKTGAGGLLPEPLLLQCVLPVQTASWKLDRQPVPPALQVGTTLSLTMTELC